MATIRLVCFVILLCLGWSDASFFMCRRNCTLENYSPICGSDGVTYFNPCIIDTVICEMRLRGKVLSRAYPGVCSETHPTVSTCDVFCDEEIESTVCASDGNTYRSICRFNRAKCEYLKSGYALRIQHAGDCSQYDQCLLLCDEQQVTPVCSLSNETFKNACFLKKTFCAFLEQNNLHEAQKFTLAKNGSCDDVDYSVHHSINCTQFMGNDPCPLDYDPVCGYDHKNYNTKCEYCKHLRDLQLLDVTFHGDSVLLGACPPFILVG